MITNTSNPRVKKVAKLNKQAKARADERAFVIEGIKLFLEAPLEFIKEIYYTEYFYEKYIEPEGPVREKYLLLDMHPTFNQMVSDFCFDRMSDTKTPQGVLCVLKHIVWDMPGLVSRRDEHPIYLLIEDLNDPGNLGTIFRTAEAAGVTAIFMNEGCADIYNPKVVRSTMGSIFRVPFVYTMLMLVIPELLKNGVNIFATCPDGAVSYEKFDFRGAAAFLIGSESHGLSEPLKRKVTQHLAIPMAGEVESLNAAVATAVFLFEATRQRRG